MATRIAGLRLIPMQGGPGRMRMVATGLLVLMAVVYAIARTFSHVHPAVGFVRAFAEAAMVGGLADWFAVTALFRHPLGLPIPHTAIIPRNKDRIGDTLALFLRDNFLTPAVVGRRMRKLDLASAAGRFLTSPPDSTGRMRDGASRLVAHMIGSLDQERLGGMVKGAISARIRGLDLAPLLGQALGAAIAEHRHLPLLDGLIRWAGKTLLHNDVLIRDMVHKRAGSIMRWTGLDETLASAIVTGLQKMLDDMANDQNHPLRAKAEEGLQKLAADLQFDERMQERVAGFRDEILENPAMLRAAKNPDAALAGKFGDMLKQLGTTLQEDARLRSTINRFARRTAIGVTASYGDQIVRLVSDTVRGWDADTITGRLENAVGRDLQYIRVNGTVVGGLVGVAIHAVDVWF
jgi:uncharacterized membrane-anchored protein YjiN (DUF445 family)